MKITKTFHVHHCCTSEDGKLHLRTIDDKDISHLDLPKKLFFGTEDYSNYKITLTIEGIDPRPFSDRELELLELI